MSKLEKLYEQSLMKWGFDWLPATPPDGYLNSFDEFKQKMESDNEFYNKVVKELNQNKDKAEKEKLSVGSMKRLKGWDLNENKDE